MTNDAISFRQGEARDSTDLALLADAATRRLVSWLWDQATTDGQSSFEVGRHTIRSDEASLTHHSRWRVAEQDGQIVGGLNGYELAATGGATPAATPSAMVAEVLAPLTELKAIAEGTWYVSVASVFAECRGQGVGQAVLAEADRCAQAEGCDTITLIVADFNPGAHRLYQRVGFEEWDRREFATFPGSDPGGNWILMRRPVG